MQGEVSQHTWDGKFVGHAIVELPHIIFTASKDITDFIQDNRKAPTQPRLYERIESHAQAS